MFEKELASGINDYTKTETPKKLCKTITMEYGYWTSIGR